MALEGGILTDFVRQADLDGFGLGPAIPAMKPSVTVSLPQGSEEPPERRFAPWSEPSAGVQGSSASGPSNGPAALTQKPPDGPREAAQILAVDDNPTNQLVILAQLDKLRYRANAVANGAEALDALDGGAYDLVLMDCQMPVMDGYEATRRIRLSKYRDLPVIAVTAHAMAGDRDKCLNSGMSDYLAKPVQLRRLSEMLTKWIGEPGDPPDSEASSSRDSKAVFDESEFLNRLMDDRKLAGTVMRAFLNDVPSQLEILRERVDEADARGVDVQAHTLKGAAATVSAVGLRDIAQEMEEAGNAGSVERVHELLPRATAEFRQLCNVVRNTGWF